MAQKTAGVVSATVQATRTLLVLLVILGLIYPGATWLVGRLNANGADGSFLEYNGQVVGSKLIGQDTSEDPSLFHPRLSSGDYDGMSSGGSNLSPVGDELQKTIEETKKSIAAENNVDPAEVPADAVTASSSGLDPHISKEYAHIQIERVAKNSGLSVTKVEELVEKNSYGSILGFIGSPRVNVNTLNLDVVKAKG